jgi:hypothetical protein
MSDPFVGMCKMTYNDVAQIKDRVRRMWVVADSEREMALVEYLEQSLENILGELMVSLDNHPDP